MDLPLLPEVASQVVQATSNENTSPRELAELVRRDQAMAAHLLRIANSPLYGGSVQIVSVQQAVARLGIAQLREIAVLISMKSRVFDVQGFEEEVRSIFKHALSSAMFGQAIAKLRRANVEEGFLCGLLHEVGRPVLVQKIIELARSFDLAVPKDLVLAATEQDHPVVGNELARRWKLADKLALTILHHRDLEPPQACRDAAFTTQLSDAFAKWLLDGAAEDTVRTHRAVAALNLYSDQLTQIFDQADHVRTAVEALA